MPLQLRAHRFGSRHSGLQDLVVLGESLRPTALAGHAGAGSTAPDRLAAALDRIGSCTNRGRIEELQGTPSQQR